MEINGGQRAMNLNCELVMARYITYRAPSGSHSMRTGPEWE